MAKYEKTLNHPFSKVINELQDRILSESATASYEDGSDFIIGEMRVAVRVYERYSFTGGNRLTLTLTIVGTENVTKVSAITSGGSQAMFFKFNTIGENAFLHTVKNVLDAM